MIAVAMIYIIASAFMVACLIILKGFYLNILERQCKIVDGYKEIIECLIKKIKEQP